ncbi:LacI family DNA-binding transcriptional regulator [Sinorhizobium medicae]|uniref:LacI family transcriptional regulator n=1 Tax=Sinorhizobium medicae TaxID=110321 RepID=A0ABX4TVE2_9HYPH|nr:LacI family DNA-binding transcriptional regulator [Sinorhizobium medicae]MDX0489742.1 substrate-binding domain-containing protein [Sinorhizobium medicae]MDX0539629.1 substrate-binding domain-containing protein [Sinorhizobium medicae]MDX0973638.1 substrate-binding domain-containing protein [Sinorhizobium medicae]MDX1146163.1 substrate-binding domain-containing protein [Sinorhizobium medicae]MDX1159331.1 substrate-binding domain-containing protein [Sinorhizobium medicae]
MRGNFPGAPKSKATIADVARTAGVSTATAGRVLGGYGYTSEKKKEQVLKAAQDLGYRPNSLARSLITGKTRTLGVVAGDIQNPFYASVLRGISNVAEANGFGLLITNSDETQLKEVHSVELLAQKQVDGLIVTPSDTRKARHLHNLRTVGVPLVLIDRAVAGLMVDRVATDNIAAAEHAVRQLIAAGHRRIAIVAELVDEGSGGLDTFLARAVAGDPIETDTLYPSWQRLLGYIRAHRIEGLPVDQRLILQAGSYSALAAQAVVPRLMIASDPPTALFTTDGTMSEGAMRALTELKLSIPQDLSIICFDDLDWMSFHRPGITTVAQPRLAMGEAAARMLLERIRGEDYPPRTVLMPAELIERGSVARL